MLEYDKRIKNFNVKNAFSDICEFDDLVDTEGYFTSKYSDFSNLELCTYGYLEQLSCNEKPFQCSTNRVWYSFFLPKECTVPKEKEKTYKAFTLETFLECYNKYDSPFSTDWFQIRNKNHNDESNLLYCGYRNAKNCPKEKYIEDGIYLGGIFYDFNLLFENYEIFLNDKWQPFGIEKA